MSRYAEHIQKCNIMTFTGQGQVTALPDLAVIRLGVQTIGENLTEIQDENARIIQDIIQSLEQIGITEIQTYRYNIERYFEYFDGNRIDRGFSVRNILEIRLSNLEQVGLVIDTAVNNGANIVDFIAFEVSEPDSYYQDALNLAVMNAFEKAKSVSINLGILMDPIPTRITENSTTPVPSSQLHAIRERAFVTPIEPGDIRIDASVTIEFTYQTNTR